MFVSVTSVVGETSVLVIDSSVGVSGSVSVTSVPVEGVVVVCGAVDELSDAVVVGSTVVDVVLAVDEEVVDTEVSAFWRFFR